MIEDAAAIGFDDTEFYRQMMLPADERSVASQELCRGEALDLANDYRLLPDRPRY